MNISINWIREFVDLPEEIGSELGKRFTLSTCEVEDIAVINEHLQRVVIAEIVKIDDHPNSDKLHLVTVNKGKESQQVVCGAPNVRVGMKVPFAPLGTTLPGGLTLTPKEIRGVVSEGMLCSEAELEIGSDDSGLKEFPADAPVGVSLAEYLNRPADILFDIDNKSITHRPDLWAQYGMAREFAAVFKKPLRNPYNGEWQQKLESRLGKGCAPVSVTVDDDSACKIYCGLYVKNVKIGESPDWMKARLNACGVRSINNMVDISNYVMLELGIPNHIFDASQIAGSRIHVRRAGTEQTFVTLDETERQILPRDTMICDAEKPVAIAGIMGGLASGVKDSTTDVFIEVANFTDAEIRKTSTRLGLRSDSSIRYEKSLDSQLVRRSSLRILDLILQLCPEAEPVGPQVIAGRDHVPYRPLVIELSCDKIRSVLGTAFPSDDEIMAILERLDFAVENRNGLLSVTVPSYRATKDVECDADIIEEVGRIVGFDNITPHAPLTRIEAVRLSLPKQLHRRIQDFLVLQGQALEVMTYPMIGEKLLKKVQWPDMNEGLVLKNAISRDNDRMRPSLIPTALQTAALNAKNFASFRFFELGRAYAGDEKQFSAEKNQLVIGFFDRKGDSFLPLLNTVEKMFDFLSYPAVVSETGGHNTVLPKEWSGVHPYEYADIRVMGKPCGAVFTVHPSLSGDLKIRGKLALAVVDLSEFENTKPKDKVKYKPLPKYPGSLFDCTVIVPRSAAAAEPLRALKGIKYKELESIRLVGVFLPEDPDVKWVTLRASFLDPEKTLDGAFLEEAQNRIVAELAKAGFPLKS